jgi:hydroxymethylbilane synthase
MRDDDERSLKYIAALKCMDSHVCVNCERIFLEVLGGNCKTPIAGQARIVDVKIVFRGSIAMSDGSEKYTLRLLEQLRMLLRLEERLVRS